MVTTMKHPTSSRVFAPAAVAGLCLGLGLFAGLTTVGCKHAGDAWALDPLDAAPMASCNVHGPQNRSCNDCNAGDTKSCLAVALHYERRFDLGRSDRDARNAALFYGRACEQGHDPACVFIGEHYRTVRGLDHPTREQATRLRDRGCATVAQACAAKDPLACRVEGMCLGDEGPDQTEARDVAGALRALTSSCDLGDPLGCARLGWLRDAKAEDDAARAQALAAYQKACDADVVEGCLGVAAHKYHGLGTPAAPDEALQIADDWCGRGSPQACQATKGHFTALWPLVTHGEYRKDWTAPDPQRIAQRELRAAWSTGVGRTGFCVRPDGAVDQVTTLDTTGDPVVDEIFRDNVAGWRFKRQPASASGRPLCLVHEQRLVMTFRSGFARPFYVVYESWMTPRGGVAILDLDRMRPSR